MSEDLILDEDGFPVCERGKRLEELGDVIEISHRKLALWSLILLVPLQVMMLVISPVVVLWVLGRWICEWKWKWGTLGWRLVFRIFWPGIVFWDWFTANECWKGMMTRCM